MKISELYSKRYLNNNVYNLYQSILSILSKTNQQLSNIFCQVIGSDQEWFRVRAMGGGGGVTTVSIDSDQDDHLRQLGHLEPTCLF